MRLNAQRSGGRRNRNRPIRRPSGLRDSREVSIEGAGFGEIAHGKREMEAGTGIHSDRVREIGRPEKQGSSVKGSPMRQSFPAAIGASRVASHRRRAGFGDDAAQSPRAPSDHKGASDNRRSHGRGAVAARARSRARFRALGIRHGSTPPGECAANRGAGARRDGPFRG